MRTLGFDLTEHHGPLLAALPQVFDNRWRLARLQRNIRHGVCSGKLKIYRYADALHWVAQHRPEFPHYPCLFVPWDNTPRAGRRAFIMTDGTPQLFEQGLREVVTTVGNKNPDHRIVFINAWNEWAEGMHLEPDQKFGRGFLDAISRVIASVPTSTPDPPVIVTPPAPVESSNNTTSRESSQLEANRWPRAAGRPRILFVAMADSVHTARWINQLAGTGWDIHLFPVGNGSLHASLSNVTAHDFSGRRSGGLNGTVRLVDDLWTLSKNGWPLPRGARLARRLRSRWNPSWNDRAWRLAQTISKLQPDIIHSLEIQHAGYLTLAAREHLKGEFPTWIMANWGSDIYLFGRLKEHKDRIRAVLAACDFYNCEGQRDVNLARVFGFQGEVLSVLPNTGGIDLSQVHKLRQPGRTSERRVILLKGYQTWAGRALVGLRALRLCADVLKGYRVGVYLAGDESVRIAAELLEEATGVPVELIPNCTHEEMLAWHGRARISIGLSISDGISTSALEAMAMGSFPIQSNTSCADEWIKCGESGFFVPPEDPQVIADAIRRAVTDDDLVDRAAEINARTVMERLDQSVIRPKVIAMYERVATPSKQKEGANQT
jgi:glycosyltransferase involved in cell wall biosynthesis